MQKFLRLTPEAAAAEHDRPSPEKLISGDPEFTTWNAEEINGLYCGIWQSTPGKWRISYDEWEYCTILSG
ncbi:MAG: cupin domain-containing protein, partial [Albidovulum sp.]